MMSMTKPKQQESWNDSDRVGFWIHAEYKHPKRMQFAIINNGILSSKIEFIREAGICHQWKEINISNLPRDKVEAIRFYPYCRNIDGIIRYGIHCEWCNVKYNYKKTHIYEP